MASLLRSVFVLLFVATTAFAEDATVRVARAVAPSDVSDAQRRLLDATSAALLKGDTATAQKHWNDFSISYFTKREKSVALPMISDFVLKNGVLPRDPDAPKRSLEIDGKQAILIGLGNVGVRGRDHVASLKQVRAANRPAMVSELQLNYNAVGVPSVLGLTQKEMSIAAIEAEIKKWEEKLNSLGDDAQLANVDLQNILQKQQQTLQMISNISKLLYDTAQAVISKIGG